MIEIGELEMYGDRYGGGYGRQSAPPVREGEEFDVTIEAVGEKGDGIARVKGFVLFVPDTKTGDEVKIRITRVLSKVGFADKIGASEKKGEKSSSAPKKEPEPEFESHEELDSDDFGSEESKEKNEESEESNEEEEKSE